MHRSVIVSRLLISLALVVVSAGMACAQDRRQNAEPRCRVEVPVMKKVAPGQFAACHLREGTPV